MYKDIKINKSEFYSYLKFPLVASDVKAYRVVCDSPGADSISVTALRADGKTFYSSGTAAEGCVLQSSLYAVPGDVKLFVTACDGNGSIITQNVICAEVITGIDGEEGSDETGYKNTAVQAYSLAAEVKTDITEALSAGGYTYDNMYYFAEDVANLVDGANSNGYAGTAEITEDLRQLMAGYTATANKPVKIGLWIDGTPIWRTAFEYEFTAYTECCAVIDIGIKSTTGVRILKQFAASYAEPLDGLGLINRSEYCKLSGSGLLIDFSNGDDSKLYGYVEFITPETNIKP